MSKAYLKKMKIEESVVEVTFPRESVPLPGDPSLFGD